MVGPKVSGIERALSGVASHMGAGDEEYVPKCVLVTGGAGFIASHVTIRLVNSRPDTKVRRWCGALRSDVAQQQAFNTD
jgi:hypothetical protein